MVVGVHRFELWASASQTQRSARLSYTPRRLPTLLGALGTRQRRGMCVATGCTRPRLQATGLSLARVIVRPLQVAPAGGADEPS